MRPAGFPAEASGKGSSCAANTSRDTRSGPSQARIFRAPGDSRKHEQHPKRCSAGFYANAFALLTRARNAPGAVL